MPYGVVVKQIWQGRMLQAATKVGDQAPMTAVGCNSCRTCVTTNVLGLALAGIAGAGFAVARFARRVVKSG